LWQALFKATQSAKEKSGGVRITIVLEDFRYVGFGYRWKKVRDIYVPEVSTPDMLIRSKATI
jgi:hypothetical protein